MDLIYLTSYKSVCLTDIHFYSCSARGGNYPDALLQPSQNEDANKGSVNSSFILLYVIYIIDSNVQIV